MRSRLSAKFRSLFAKLPKDVKRHAYEAYGLFRIDPYHPSLHFKRVHLTKSIFSVRIGLDYRALGLRREDGIVWFWIGPHAEYDHILNQL